MLRRTFTLAQANALVPWLNEQFSETRQLAKELRALRMEIREGEHVRSLELGGRMVIVEPSKELLGRVGAVEDEIKAKLEEAIALGLEVRRVDGLVDFPAWLDGQMIFLCWRFGETEVSFWHPTTKGSDHRRPLPEGTPRVVELN